MDDSDQSNCNDPTEQLAKRNGVSQQFYLISDGNVFANNNQVMIAPKVVQGTIVGTVSGSRTPATKLPQLNALSIAHVNPPATKGKKRDERRRVTHNEVERRRRDKINHWIEKLGKLIPVDGEPGGTFPLDRPSVVNSEYASKGGILSKACDYVTALHVKVNTLSECKKESERINMETKRLREANTRLIIENDLLRDRLSKLGISPIRIESVESIEIS